jgi:hypothetical protein
VAIVERHVREGVVCVDVLFEFIYLRVDCLKFQHVVYPSIISSLPTIPAAMQAARIAITARVAIVSMFGAFLLRFVAFVAKEKPLGCCTGRL